MAPRRSTAPPCDAACPVRRAMDVLDGKWTLLVIRELLGGTKRFGELLGAIGGVSPRVLAQRLQLLESHGVLRRDCHAEVPPRVEYSLLPAGESLRPVVESLATWGAKLPQDGT